MNKKKHYIIKGEYLIRKVLLFYFIIVIFLGQHVSNINFIISLFFFFCGFFIRILSYNKKVYIDTDKPETFFLTSRHPMIFAYLLYMIPFFIYFKMKLVSIMMIIIFIVFTIAIIQHSEEIYTDYFSKFQTYKKNVPILFPKMNIKIKDIFNYESKSQKLIDMYEFVCALIPIIIIICIQYNYFEKFVLIIKNLFS